MEKMAEGEPSKLNSDNEMRFPMKTHVFLEWIVILLAATVVINTQSSALTNPYVCNDDALVHTYWMQQFHDKDLFRDDFLTVGSKTIQPLGIIALYYLFSFVIHPIMFGKILPIILIPISCLYLFRLVRDFTNNFTAFVAALLLMLTPFYFNCIVGGHARAFGYPLLIAFLYYLKRKDYLKVSLTLVLQSLFYPVTCLLSLMTCFFRLLDYNKGKVSFNHEALKSRPLIWGITLCLCLLCLKNLVAYNPSIGHPVTRSQMAGNMEFYSKGRYSFIPTAYLRTEVQTRAENGFDLPALLDRFRENNRLKDALILIAILFLIYERSKKRLFFPSELLFLFISACLLYKVANIFILKLYLPRRYIEYSIPLISLIVFAIAVGVGIARIKHKKTRISAQVLAIALVLWPLHLRIPSELTDITDYSHLQYLYKYLKTLPKDSLIAAHPTLSDGIPAFAQRKVFTSYKLSQTIYYNYWQTVKARLYDFFNAYYSDNPKVLYSFFVNNKIDYLLVDQNHFTKTYLSEKKVYFEPFNSYVSGLIDKRQDFVLNRIPKKDRIFVGEGMFLVTKDVFNTLK